MAYIIAVSNEKGGVAKTTTTLSLGAALTEGGSRVLLVDMDPQANLTLSMGFEPSKVEHTIGGVLINSEPLQDVLLKSSILGLDLIPSNMSMEHTERVLATHNENNTFLRTAIQQVQPMPYEFILLDCPPSLGLLTLNALTAAGLLIIPTQAEYFSAYALRDMMSIIRQIRAKSNPELAYRILITLLDRRNRTHKDIQEQLVRAFGEGLFTTIIEIDTKLRESPILGIPITHYRPSSRGAQQYRMLAEELNEYVHKAYSEAS